MTMPPGTKKRIKSLIVGMPLGQTFTSREMVAELRECFGIDASPHEVGRCIAQYNLQLVAIEKKDRRSPIIWRRV